MPFWSRESERVAGFWVSGVQVSFPVLLLNSAGSRHLGRVRRRELSMPSRFLLRLFKFLSLVLQLSFLLPFRRHSRSLLPTGRASIISCRAVVNHILYEAKLEFAPYCTITTDRSRGMTAIVHWDRCSRLPVTNDKGEILFMRRGDPKMFI